MGLDGGIALFVQRIEILGRGAEQADLLVAGEIPQHVAIRVKRRAVIEHQGGAGGEGAHQPVPHHPAAGGEVEDPLPRLDVAVQLMLFQVLQQGAADAVHDALGFAGGAGGVEDIERVVESHRLEGELGIVLARQHLLPVVAKLQRVAEQGDHHRLLYAADLAHHAGDLLLNVDSFAVVAIAIHRKQHPRPGLAEALYHAGLAKVGAGGGPDCPEAGGCQHGNHGFRNIGQIGGDHIATTNPLMTQPLSQPGNLFPQFTPAQSAAWAPFDAGDDGRALVLAAQQVFGEVEAAVGEPAGALHILTVLRHYVAELALDAAVLPYQRPETGGLLHRPLIKLRVVLQLQAVETVHLRHKTVEVGLLHPERIRLPQAEVVHE